VVWEELADLEAQELRAVPEETAQAVQLIQVAVVAVQVV
jgi:hypothetical protein